MEELIHEEEEKEMKIIIDRCVMEKYKKYYFKKYPRRRKFPFEGKSGVVNPIPPSLNKWMIMKRPQMNDTKQKWKEFAIWLVECNGLTNIKLDNVTMLFTYYFPTRHRHDADNYTPKFAMDGFTESGLLVDDDLDHVKMISISGGYDKDNPRVEITINII